MKSFSSQIGTKSAPGELQPFGWTRSDKRFRDAAAVQIRSAAEAEGRAFGRRQAAPERQSALKRTMPDRLARFVADPAEKNLIRHPRVKFTRSV